MPARSFDSTALLAVWEDGFSRTLPDRAIRLLDAARPREDGWPSATIGERDRALIELRQELFGARFDAEAACPACGERLEFLFRAEDVTVPALSAAPADHVNVEADGYKVACRVPTAGDLVDAPDAPTLLARCAGGNADLPESVVATVSGAIAKADPTAEIRLSMTCPQCGHAWQPLFDIVSFLWGEIEDWAHRLMLEVHYLASAYGWSEKDIVAMPARRRRMYLEMAGVA
jgi:hypothetical protein